MKLRTHMRIMRSLRSGQSLARVMMNLALESEEVRGLVADIGGGRNPDYYTHLRHNGAITITPVDGSISGIDFEKDALPFKSGAVDTIVLCNVLEHIYNHRFLLSESARILRSGGSLVGFVPFWLGYHADPHDYFRYTDEALNRLLGDAGLSDVRVVPVGGGPFLANFNTIMLSIPLLVRIPLFIPYALLDALFVRLRPESRKRNPLGYVFTGRK